jgi:hypothetical protein
VIRNGRIVSLAECDRPSKNMNTTTEATDSIRRHTATATRRPRMDP